MTKSVIRRTLVACYKVPRNFIGSVFIGLFEPFENIDGQNDRHGSSSTTNSNSVQKTDRENYRGDTK